jgi:hypothetical protein
MRRERYVEKMLLTQEGYFQPLEGDVGVAQAQALALVSVAPTLVETLLNHVAALNEFGGEIYIAAHRVKLDHGVPVEHNATGKQETIGFLVGYSKRAQIKDQAEEADTGRGVASSEQPTVEFTAENGEQPELEPEEVASEG